MKTRLLHQPILRFPVNKLPLIKRSSRGLSYPSWHKLEGTVPSEENGNVLLVHTINTHFAFIFEKAYRNREEVPYPSYRLFDYS